jgi:hypothetical protein
MILWAEIYDIEIYIWVSMFRVNYLGFKIYGLGDLEFTV